MKWGVRRYQPYSSVPRKSGKSGKMVGAAKKANKVNKGKSSSSKKKRGAKSNNNKDQYRPKPSKQNKLNDAQKEELIRSGDIKRIAKYSNQLNNNEMRQAMDRVNLNKQMAALNPSQRMSGKERADQIFRIANDVHNKANTGINLYNDFAKIYNSLSGEPIPVIDGKYKKKTSAEVKKILNTGSAEEVWKEVKKGNVSMDDWKAANNRFMQEKATRAAMDREKEWAAADREAYLNRRTRTLDDNPFDTSAASRMWDNSSSGAKSEREDFERTTKAAQDWVRKQESKQPVLLLDYDKEKYAENKRLYKAMQDSGERYARRMEDDLKKKKR